MKKKQLILIVLAVGLAGAAWGQRLGQKPSIQLGVRAGISLADMQYSYIEYQDYHHPLAPLATGRLFAEYRSVMGLGFRLEGGLTRRGVHLRWGDVDYSLAANYADARLLMVYCIRNQSTLSPYIALGGTASGVVGGNIRYQSVNFGRTSLPLNNYNINKTDFGFYGAVGLEYRLRWGTTLVPLSLEVGYARGFMNTYSPHETAGESIIANNEIDVKPSQGTRFNQGIEITISASILFQTNNTRKILRQRRRIQRRGYKSCIE